MAGLITTSSILRFGGAYFRLSEYIDVASLHLLTADLYGAERHHNAISARTAPAAHWRAVPEHADEIIFQQGACRKG